MSKPSFKRIALLLGALLPATLLLSGCAGSASVVGGKGETISTVQGEAYDGPKARVVVGRIIDRSANAGKNSLIVQLNQLMGKEHIDTQAVLGGMRDMLTDAMFNTRRFILLDREMLDAALVEQEFLARNEMSAIPGQLPPATLETMRADGRGRRRRARRPGSERGQTFPFVLTLMLALFITSAVVINIGQAVNRRIFLQITADAGAYTGATEMARGMNTIGDINGKIQKVWGDMTFATKGFGLPAVQRQRHGRLRLPAHGASRHRPDQRRTDEMG